MGATDGSEIRLAPKQENSPRRFKAGDKVRIKSKSVGRTLEKTLQLTASPSDAFHQMYHQTKIGYVVKIFGDPYQKQDLYNYFQVAGSPDTLGGDGFAPQDLELLEPEEAKSTQHSDPRTKEGLVKKEIPGSVKEEVKTISGKIEIKELETEGELFGFFLNDIITCECQECDWDGKYVLIRGFDHQNKRLYGIVFDGIEIDYDVMPEESSHKQKLRIVQRDPMRLGPLFSRSMANPPQLEIGDEVIVTNGGGAGLQGKVIGIPQSYGEDLYLVELFGFKQGEKTVDHLLKAPSQKTLPSSCLFKEARELLKLSDLDMDLKSVLKEATVQEKRLTLKEEKRLTPEEQAQKIIFWYLEEILEKKERDYPLANPGARVEPGILPDRKILEGLLDARKTDSARIAIRELGIFLYEMLTGHSERTNISFHLDGYPLMQNYNPDVSKKLSIIIQRMIAGDFRSPQELRKAFESKPSTEDKISVAPEPLIKNRLAYEKLLKEFHRQEENLVRIGVPELAGISENEFRQLLEPLKTHLKELSLREFPEGHIPFVIVLREKLLSLEKEVPLMELDGKKGFTILNLSELKTADGVEIPESLAYLVIDVENGKVMLGKSADEAVKQFKKEGRSPLTAEEGVAVILQHPEILKDHYMDLPGSRLGDGNVASLWLVEGEPRLHWNRAYHSLARWGSASCGSRVGP